MRSIMRCPTSVWRWTTAHSTGVSGSRFSSSAAGIADLADGGRHLGKRRVGDADLASVLGRSPEVLLPRGVARQRCTKPARRLLHQRGRPPKLAAGEHARSAVAPHLDQERHLRVEPQEQSGCQSQRAQQLPLRGITVGIADPGGVRPATVQHGQRHRIAVELVLAADQPPALRRAGEAGHPGRHRAERIPPRDEAIRGLQLLGQRLAQHREQLAAADGSHHAGGSPG
jgi:hypothetical protein